MQVSVLTKVPLPGRVKTRLIPALGKVLAASLHEAMAADVGGLLDRACVAPDWHVDGPLAHAWAVALPGRVKAQVSGDLGARIQAALGRRACLALGVDSPTLPVALLRQALQSKADVVLGPAFDGGCWAIGQARRHAGWLDEMAWSDHTVCAALVERARARDLSVELLPYWADVDEPADLRWLIQQLRMLPATAAVHTRLWLEHNPEQSWRT